jgi:hypothetical protein
MKATLLITFLILTAPVVLLAQGFAVDPPAYGAIFATFTALVLAIPFVTEAIKKIAGVTGGTAAQIISWVTGIALAGFGYLLNLGMFADLEIWQSLVVGLGASLAANGVFDTGIIEWILKLLGIIKEK